MTNSPNVILLNIEHPDNDKGKSYESTIPSGFSLVDVVNQNIKELIKVRNVESKSLNQTIETLNDCDNPSNKNVIEKIPRVKTGSSKTMHETPSKVDPKSVCENVIQNASKNVSDAVNNIKGLVIVMMKSVKLMVLEITRKIIQLFVKRKIKALVVMLVKMSMTLKVSLRKMMWLLVCMF